MAGAGIAATVMVAIAVTCAFGSLFAGGLALVRRWRAVEGRQARRGGMGAAALEVAALRPLAGWLLDRAPGLRRRMTWVEAQLGQRGVAADATGLVSALLAVAAAVGVVAAWAGSSPVWAPVGAVGTVVGAVGGAGMIEARARTALREQTPEALRSMNRCMQAGMTLPQMFEALAGECSGRLGAVFAQAARMARTGATTPEVLGYLRQIEEVPELVFLSVALEVQHRTGGSMAQVMEAASQSVRSRLDLMRQLQVQTAQARTSALVVTLLPFGLLAVLSVISPGFLDPFFGSVAGWLLLGLALCMQLAGVLVVRRILKEAQ